MSSDRPAPTIDIAAACADCRAAMQRYRRREPYDDAPCLAVARGAIIGRDDGCWAALHELCGDLVLLWCGRATADGRTDTDDLVSATWEKFYRYYSPEHFAAAKGMGDVLAYLRMCAKTAAIDAARQQQRREHSLDRAGPGDVRVLDALTARAAATGHPTLSAGLIAESPAARVEATEAHAELWRIVMGVCKGEREQTLARLTYVQGLKSAEVAAQRPDLFASVQEVYRLTRNLHDRLARSPELRAWLADRRGESEKS